MDFYSALGGISCLLLGFSTRGSGAGVVATTLGKRLLSPWSLMAQGIAAGSMVYMLGNGVGLPMQKVSCCASPLWNMCFACCEVIICGSFPCTREGAAFRHGEIFSLRYS